MVLSSVAVGMYKLLLLWGLVHHFPHQGKAIIDGAADVGNVGVYLPRALRVDPC